MEEQRKQVGVGKKYKQRPRQVKCSWDRNASMRTSLQAEDLVALSEPQLSNQAKMRKKCCYGQEKNLGQYSSLSLSPLISHTQQNITLSRIKCEKFIVLWRSVFICLLKSSLSVDYVSTYIYINVYLYLYTHSIQYNTGKTYGTKQPTFNGPYLFQMTADHGIRYTTVRC